MLTYGAALILVEAKSVRTNISRVANERLDTSSACRAQLVSTLEALEERLRWLSSWTIHNANYLRESLDGLTVGGHQAS